MKVYGTKGSKKFFELLTSEVMNGKMTLEELYAKCPPVGDEDMSNVCDDRTPFFLFETDEVYVKQDTKDDKK